jgi:hypothetical protein
MKPITIAAMTGKNFNAKKIQLCNNVIFEEAPHNKTK